MKFKYRKPTKLNILKQLLPEGLLADAAWFTRRGYSNSLRNRYLASDWLQQITRGVFRRPLYKPGPQNGAVPLHWQHVVLSLQMVMERAIVVGGRTALELQGFSHYTSSSDPREVHLYGDEPAPGWLKKTPHRDAIRVSQRQETLSCGTNRQRLRDAQRHTVK